MHSDDETRILLRKFLTQLRSIDFELIYRLYAEVQKDMGFKGVKDAALEHGEKSLYLTDSQIQRCLKPFDLSKAKIEKLDLDVTERPKFAVMKKLSENEKKHNYAAHLMQMVE
eukprot:TRINITY_DN67694_c0_g1_i1.p3 TRINITY_DN67694_c0_g1~~TRINITY_DN67694_c0_g1_i1.p3  ORF type:complete len:113 (-),score=8.11 TRINITY_DN67694_c0_g1_i1:2197-2535(-)